MNPTTITEFITSTFSGVKVVVASSENGAPEAAWGDIFFIYDPNDNLPPHRQFPFATIVVKDYSGFDEASKLNRPGIFRLNLGLSKVTYRAALGLTRDQHGTAEETEVTHDFAAIDKLMPHPIYGSQSWICILNPSPTTFQEKVETLIETAYLKSTGALRSQAGTDEQHQS